MYAIHHVIGVCVLSSHTFLQLLPAIGVSDQSSARAQMMESLPIIKQINEEFRDPVSSHTYILYIACAHTGAHNTSYRDNCTPIKVL